jgi:lysozyme family protein
MNENFNKAFEEVIGIEGGYSDDKNDSGGETNFGITKKVAEANGYTGSMKDIPMEKVKEIYYKGYWLPNKLDQIDDLELTMEIFEQSVNMGNKRPAVWLQENLNALNDTGKKWNDITEDGNIGSGTITAINSCLSSTNGKKRLMKLMNICQGIFYRDLVRKREKDERFLGGWLDNRVKF